MGRDDTSAYLAHIASRIEADLNFLVETGALTKEGCDNVMKTFAHEMAAPVRAVFASANATPAPASTPSGGVGSIVAAFKKTIGGGPKAATPPVVAPEPPVAGPVMLKALWDWEDENDLSFKAGDRIELVEETSPEWWTGKMGGRTGLFPSNYVEKVVDTPAVHVNNRASAHMQSNPTYRAANLNNFNRLPPPPAQGGSHDQCDPPPATNAIGLTAPAVDEKKKSKFGGYGKTMAHSAAGGVGFGAGAAIGGGLVRAIF